ncbi:PGSC2-like protein [Mya arenaria]|uniref:Peptidoglycan-recognition protein n=1 Tax=Mya arenaria TaxID=6604 RepID=A0ABY7EAF3_MYAAR|nr:PGSC2-like protein [Mya arenaria]
MDLFLANSIAQFASLTASCRCQPDPANGATDYCVKNPSSECDVCSKVNIVTRSQWGARDAKSNRTMHTPVSEFFIHHTDTPTCTDITSCKARVQGIQNYHMDHNGWSDIGYNFLVGEDGNVYEGRGWSFVGAHTQNYNSIAFGASMIGRYDSHLPNDKALTAVKNLIACGIQLCKIRSNYRLYGHRDAGQTSCPGDNLYTEIQTWPHYSHAHP